MGDHLFSDIAATFAYNNKLKAGGSKASWEAIAVIEELTLVDPRLEQGDPARLIP